MPRLIRFCCAVAVVFVSVCAFGQIAKFNSNTPNATFIRDPQTYGTQGEIAYVIPASAFNPFWYGLPWQGSANSGIKYVTSSGGCCLDGPVLLPSGASITGIEVEGCDYSTTGQLAGYLVTCSDPLTCTDSTDVLTVYSAAPGCGFFRVNISPALTINNATKTYFFEYSNDNDTSGNVFFMAARVYYKLQISPDPGTATFADVPVGHPFHRFVEALYASGITGGCGGGNYCPDAPVTRGQMAVFLAGALGLHWAP
jgi:hypothetical protein